MKKLVLFAALSAAMLGGLGAAKAQDYPARAVKIIVPFLPGASTDALGRIMAENLTPKLGQSVVVENKPGGGSLIGVDTVAKAQPDGYTLLWATSDGMSNLPAVKKGMPYNVPNDFTFITRPFTMPFTLVVSTKLPITSVQELVAYARANPGKLRFGSSGTAGIADLGCSLLENRAGIKIVHVPYKGMSQVVTDILGGFIDIALITPPTIAPHAGSDKIRIIATSGDKRSPLFENLPTIAESGYPDVIAIAYYGLVGPRGLPEPIVARLQKESAEFLKEPAVLEKLKNLGFVPDIMNGAIFQKFVVDDLAKWKAVAEAEKIVLEE
jgi:tripartite-type tricarboxylate transporter receptor subunit TctC